MEATPTEVKPTDPAASASPATDPKEPTLTEEDEKFVKEAEDLQTKAFEPKDPDNSEALKLLTEALEAIRKSQNVNTKVRRLEGQICQDIAWFHKSAKSLINSLKFSQQALDSDPLNWQALLNRAELTTLLAPTGGPPKGGTSLPKTDAEFKVEFLNQCLTDLEKAKLQPDSQEDEINRVMHTVYMKMAVMHPEQPKALEAVSKAIDIKADCSSLFMRFRILLVGQEWEKAEKDGNQILELDPDFLKGQFKKRWMKMATSQKKKVPVTVLTGFLGSVKTTLLNRLLKDNHGKKIAVIENEFGAVGIDDQLVESKQYQEEAIIEVMNGCICCTVREDLITTLTEMKSKYVDAGKIDYIIIETTGMADPAPVIQTFLLNDDVMEWCKIDSCITVCDASQIIERLAEDREEGCENEAVEQVCFADKVFLNKIDLCTREQLDAATAKIREFNTQCPVEEVQFTLPEIPFSQILDQDMFSIERALEIDDELLNEGEQPEHKHDSRIGTFSYKMEAEMTLEGANKFLGDVLMEKGANIYRMKGFLAIQGLDQKYVFHSVGMLTSCTPYKPWGEDEKRECVFVIIGKHLEQKWLEDKFKGAAIGGGGVVETIVNKTLEMVLGKQQ